MLLREEVKKLTAENILIAESNRKYRTDISNANEGMEKYKKAITSKYSEERDSMLKDFGEIKIELFKKIAESEITIKKLNKKISNDKRNCLINPQQLQLESPSDVLLFNTTVAEPQNENVRVLVSWKLLENGKVAFNI
jgi:hypothetical protein